MTCDVIVINRAQDALAGARWAIVSRFDETRQPHRRMPGVRPVTSKTQTCWPGALRLTLFNITVDVDGNSIFNIGAVSRIDSFASALRRQFSVVSR